MCLCVDKVWRVAPSQCSVLTVFLLPSKWSLSRVNTTSSNLWKIQSATNPMSLGGKVPPDKFSNAMLKPTAPTMTNGVLKVCHSRTWNLRLWKPCDQLTDLFDFPLVSLFEFLPLSNIEKFFKQLIFFRATFLWVVTGWGLGSLARHKFQQCRESDRQHHPRLVQKIQNYSSYSQTQLLHLQ